MLRIVYYNIVSFITFYYSSYTDFLGDVMDDNNNDDTFHNGVLYEGCEDGLDADGNIPLPEPLPELVEKFRVKLQESADRRNSDEAINRPMKMIPRQLKVFVDLDKEKFPEARTERFYQACIGTRFGYPVYIKGFYINRFGQIYGQRLDKIYSDSLQKNTGNNRDNHVSRITLTDKQFPRSKNGTNQKRFSPHTLVANTFWIKPHSYFEVDHINDDLFDEITGLLSCRPEDLQWIHPRDHDRKTLIDQLVELPGFGKLLPVEIYESIWGIQPMTVDTTAKHYYKFSNYLKWNGQNVDGVYSYYEKYFSQESLEVLHNNFHDHEEPYPQAKERELSSLGTPLELRHFEEVEEEFYLFYPLRLSDHVTHSGYYINKVSQIYSASKKGIHNQTPGRRYGSMSVYLSTDGEQKHYTIRKIMGSTFFESFDTDEWEVIHIRKVAGDGEFNNRLDNLRIVARR